MSTGGYDVVLQIHEDIINTFLEINYCMGRFEGFQGTYTLPLEDVPERLSEFIEIGYEVSLEGVPVIDFTDDAHILLRARGEVKFTVLGGIEFELEVQFRIAVSPTHDQSTSRLSIAFIEAAIEDVELNDTYHLPRNVLERLNEILAIAMEEYLTEDLTSLPLTPVLFSLNLPHMPPGEENRLTVGMGTVKTLTPTMFSAAFNLLGYRGGDIDAMTDFTGTNHLGVGISEDAVHRVYDFWWDRTTHPKSVLLSDTHDFDVPEADWVDELSDLLTWLLSFGIVAAHADIDRLWADYTARLTFSKFNFDLRPGNRIWFSGTINADLRLNVWSQTTITGTSMFGRGSHTDTERIVSLSVDGLIIDIESAEASITLDEENRLTVDLSEADIDIPLEWDIAEDLLDYVVDSGIGWILDNYPPLVLSPAVIGRRIPPTDITVELTLDRLEIDGSEIRLTGDIETSGRETYARYIANLDSMEVHLNTCEFGRMVRGDHRVYYCSLEEALSEGYDGCYYCIPEHHHH